MPQSSLVMLTAIFCIATRKGIGFLTMDHFRPSRRQCQHHSPATLLCHRGPSSPIEHAFPQQPEYQFALRPVQSGTSSDPIPIDPALIPLPGGADADLRHGPTIANAIGLKRAEKVAGSRRKGKGKERADPKGKKRQVNGKIRYPSTDEYYDDDEENRNPFRLDRPWDHLESPHRSLSRIARPISRRRTPSAGPSRRPMSCRRTPTPGPSRHPMSRRRTPTPGPSRLPALLPSPSPPPARISIPDAIETHAATSAITGNAVELVVTPRHGPAVAFIVSPTKPSNTPTGN
ncbi:hypothetical protein MSAN_00139000 [Mycena sanguinolenta]|uniref:Uncharacterized protein n=1 Tax=Mycena sanguinolenta TaxID=230812 RepID=A0A8H6ZDT7_9AGAR|nr:hypothetical protein MSAN_00139000 [Mycena sanguinolenta]